MAKSAHPFSPIVNEERLQAAKEYVAQQSLALARAVLGRELSLDTICFFTHSPEEYEFLQKAVRRHGPESRFSHGQTLYVDTDFTVYGQHIRIFGVRQPDANLPHIGYGDYPVGDYNQILENQHLNPYMKEITSGRGRPLIELRHPDFDVLGFIVDEEEHNSNR